MPSVEPRSGPDTSPHAEPPRIPPPTRELERAEAERKAYIKVRELAERHSILRGLLLLAVMTLVLSIARAGLDRVFPHGWWKP